MHIDRFVTSLPTEFYAWGTMSAYPRDSRRYVNVCADVQGMSTPSNLHFLNLAVRQLARGECYLEVGTWRGLTLIGALLGNRAHGYAIDNSTMVEHNKDGRQSADVWEENVSKYGMASRASYIDGEVPAIFSALHIPPVGVYFFDGDKSTPQAAYDGLMGVVPYLAKTAAIIVDDANTPQVREAAFWFCYNYRDKAVKLLDIPTPSNCWASFWNGVLLIGWGVAVEQELG